VRKHGELDVCACNIRTVFIGFCGKKLKLKPKVALVKSDAKKFASAPHMQAAEEAGEIYNVRNG